MVISSGDNGPSPARRDFESLKGHDWLLATARGDIPAPEVFEDMGLRLLEVEEGRVTCEMRLQSRHINVMDVAFGGTIAALADMSTGLAVVSITPEGFVAPTLEIKVNFVRPAVLAEPLLRAEGTVLSKGRTTVLAKTEIRDERNRLLAFATATFSLVPMGR